MEAAQRSTACPELTPGERALAESSERYRSLFTYHPHAAFSVDLEGRYTAANAAALAMTGLTLEEMRSIDFAQVIHPDDVAAVQAAFVGALNREPRQVETRVIRADGRVREVKVTAIPVIVADEVVGVHGISEDVTEANRLRRELEAANAAKVLFLANVSHEVRTPLTSVIGATELLMDEELGPRPTRFVSMVHRSCQRLMGMVDDILDFSRLEARAVTLRSRPFAVRDLAADVREWAAPRADTQGLQFTLSIDADVPAVSYGDDDRISQVVTNLVVNALKFTPTGEVDLRVSAPTAASLPHTAAVDQDQCHAWVRFDVTDTGVGIDPADFDSLFDPFTQVDPSTTRTHGGVGLGLAICRDLATLMGGTLCVTSAPGLGSTFSFLVPLGTPDRVVDGGGRDGDTDASAVTAHPSTPG